MRAEVNREIRCGDRRGYAPSPGGFKEDEEERVELEPSPLPPDLKSRLRRAGENSSELPLKIEEAGSTEADSGSRVLPAFPRLPAFLSLAPFPSLAPWPQSSRLLPPPPQLPARPPPRLLPPPPQLPARPPLPQFPARPLLPPPPHLPPRPAPRKA